MTTPERTPHTDQQPTTRSSPRSAVASYPRSAGNRALAEILVQRKAAGPPTIQRDVVSDVEKAMSYSWKDWAITDSEAVNALNQLATLNGTALTNAMSSLSSKAKQRLLDNLPDRARNTTAYTKVLVAMGPTAVLPYVQSLLRYGVFDWAITDDDAATVFRIFVALTPDQKKTLAEQIGKKFRARLADNLKRDSAIGEAEQTTLRALFDATTDAEVTTLKDWMTIRFRVKFGTESGSGEGALEWDGPSLRRMYNVLQALPPGAVEANPKLTSIDRYKDTKGAGGYYAEGLTSGGQIAMGTQNLTDLDGGPNGGFTEVADPLVGQNIFDEIVRHEVGHAVDAKLGMSDKYCVGPAGGSWQKHGNGSGLAAAMVAASGSIVTNLSAARKDPIIQVLQETIDNRDPTKLTVKLMLLPMWSRLSRGTQQAILNDPVVTALQGNFSDINNPWYKAAGGGVKVGGRIYQESYAGTWVSYDPAARARKVSLYQFRSPGEWFAEAYNAYYAPPTKGAVLAARDPATKVWFDTNVDEATGGSGAAAPGPALPAANSGPGFP